MRFAYADPPYPGMAKLYRDHPDYDGEVDHPALIARLVAEFPDGWALSTHSPAIRILLPLCPRETRILSWVRSDGGKAMSNVHPTYSWEPVLLCGGRYVPGIPAPDSWVCSPFVGSNEERAKLKGQKPPSFSFWLFRCLGAIRGDELVDLFPGSGAVGHAWDRFQRQAPLPTTPAAKATQASLEGT